MATSAKLANVPSSAHELKEYVGALFHAARYFVETRIVEQDFQEILDLDAVAISYEQGTPSAVLAEAKGGGGAAAA